MFSFATPAPTQSAVAQQPASTGFSFGSIQSQPAQQSVASAPTFSFGSSQPSSTTQSTGLLLGSSTGLATSLTTTATAAPAALTAARDLGGEGAAGGNSASASKDPKDQPLPAELSAIVESFKNSLKEQKTIRDENNQPRYSTQPIIDISNELEETLQVKLSKLDVVLRKNKKTIDVLKKQTSALVSDAEAANRSVKSQGLDVTGTQYPFTPSRYAPSSTHVYFSKLVDQYEEQMSMYSKQIRELARHLDNLNKTIEPAELVTVVRRQHEALITLASEIYAVHEHVARYSDDARVTAPLANTTIAIRHGGEQLPDDEVRQATIPISFPTFVRHEKPAASPATKTEASNPNRFPEAVSLSSPSSMATQQLSPGNMSVGSPVSTGIANQTLDRSVTGVHHSILF